VPAHVGPWHSPALAHRSSRSDRPAASASDTDSLEEGQGMADDRPGLPLEKLASARVGRTRDRASPAAWRRWARSSPCVSPMLSSGTGPTAATWASAMRWDAAAGTSRTMLRLRRGVLRIVWVRRGGRDRAAGL